MRYMLDTNMCIFLMKNRAKVVERYRVNKADGITISAITAAELQFGVFNSAQPEKNRNGLTAFFIGLTVLDFDESAAFEYGRIRTDLQRNGTPIGPLDTLIAAHAKAHGMILVTNNTREFARVKGLALEDWSDGL